MCVCVPVNQRGTREISGSLRANRVWRAPGSDFSPDCEENLSGVMSLFARIYFFVCHFSDSYIHERESHIYGGNAAGEACFSVVCFTRVRKSAKRQFLLP